MIKENINEIKKQLIKRAKEKGLYENFGQKEYSMLKYKYGDSEELDLFFNWCVNFSQDDLR